MQRLRVTVWKNYAANGLNNSAACICKRGYGFVGENSPCQLCDVGEYKAEPGNQPCSPCDLGETTANIGADNETLCICDKGYYSAANGQCQACAAGSYAPDTGGAACTPCDADTYGEDPGLDSEGDACTACPSHSTSSPGAQFASSCQCEAGYESSEVAGSPISWVQTQNPAQSCDQACYDASSQVCH